MNRDVFLLAEIKHHKLRSVSIEGIAAAKKMAGKGQVVAVLMGEKVDDFGKELIAYGADRVLIIEHPLLKNGTSDSYAQALFKVMAEETPSVIVFAHSKFGKELAPRAAVRLEAGLVSGVVNIENEEGELLFTRPIYSGKAMEKNVIKGETKLVMIRPDSFSPIQRDPSREGPVSFVDIEIENVRMEILEETECPRERVKVGV